MAAWDASLRGGATMAGGQLNTVLRHLRRLGAQAGAGKLDDRLLLERFVSQRDQAAFEAILARHGPMVLNVCRRVLSDPGAVEDAFQATFVVLVRKAGAVRKGDLLANWLYGVAYRTAARAKVEAAKRRARESAAPARQPRDPLGEITVRELLAVLDEEVYRLPARFRAPLLLCYLESKTRDEAARELGCSLATLDRRLGSGRELLRTRLGRRGLAPSAALLAFLLGPRAAPACVPAPLAAGTLKAASLVATGRAVAGAVSPQALSLAEGMLKTMLATKMKLRAVLLLACCTLAAWSGLTAYRLLAAPHRPDQKVAAPKSAGRSADRANPAPEAQPRTDLFGDPLPESAVARLGTIRFRPGGYVTSIDFTPDGKQLVSHASGRGVNVWDAATGKELCRFTPAANDWINAALLTADGQAVVTLEGGNQGDFVRVRDRGRLKVRRAFPVPYMYSARLTPDARLLVALSSAGNDVTVVVLDFRKGKTVRSWKAHRGYFWAIGLSADGKTLATGGTDKTLRLWDVATGKLLREIDGRPNVISRVALSPRGSLVASLGSKEIKHHGGGSSFPWENRIRIWDTATGKELRQLRLGARGVRPGEAPAFSMVAFTPDGKALLTASNDGTLRLWDPATGKEKRRVVLGDQGLTTLAFTADSKTVAVAGTSIRLINLATGKDKRPARGPRNAAGALPVAPDGRTAATIREGFVQLWDAMTGRPRGRIGAAGHGVAGLHPSADGRTLITMGADNTLRVWDVPGGKERRRFRVPNPSAVPTAGWLLAVTPDLATAAVMNADKSLHVLDLATGKKRLKLPGNGDWIYGAALTPDGRTLIVCDSDHTAHVWDVAAGKKRRRFEFADPGTPAAVPVPVPAGGKAGRGNLSYAAAASPDGRLLAYGSQLRYLAVHETATGKAVRLLTGLPDGPSVLAFSPDRRVLAWGGWRDPTIHLVELASGKERHRLKGHKGRLTSLAFSADGRVLISGSEDTTGLVWDLAGKLGTKDHAGGPQTVPDFDACWADLAGGDAARAYRGMRRFLTSPAEAVPHLRRRLRPVPVVDEKRLARLIADLDSNRFAVRAAAQKELDRLGEAAAGACRKAREGRPSVEVRRRLESLLGKQGHQEWDPSPQRLRALRALEVLELLGTEEAREVLKALARGAPGAQLTREAKASLQRLSRLSAGGR
jgi:RNA polymerase sigma factor (sigma-70 family)